MLKSTAACVAGATACLSLVTPAHALNTRTWISGTGIDQAGCGPIATPCRSLQYAHDATAASGEIDVKDSAGYGSVVITKAITIIGDGSLAGVLAGAGENAITVNAGPTESVTLRGLTIEGAGVGANGIVFHTGAKLDVSNCLVQNFVGGGQTVGNGILLQPSSGNPTLLISGTRLSRNGYAGLFYLAPSGATGTPAMVIDGVVATDNAIGLAFNGSTLMTLPTVMVSSSIASKNTNAGFSFGPDINATADLCAADYNGTDGYLVSNSTTLAIGRSRGIGNAHNGINASAGNLYSFQNSEFLRNGSGDVSGTITPVSLK